MQTIQKSLLSFALGLTITFSIGCGGPPLAIVYPAEGVVTVDGKPMEGIAVSLVPETGPATNGGYAVTDASGAFKVMSRDGQVGVPEGKYKVVFQKLRLPDGSPIPEGASAADVDAKNMLPDAYANPEQSTMFAIIKPEGSEPMEFDLSSKRRS